MSHAPSGPPAVSPYPPGHGWAILAAPPGVRDLGDPDPWDVSLARARRRRAAAAARRPSLQRATTARISLALATVTLLAPVAQTASAQTATAADVAPGALKVGSRGPDVVAAQRALGVSADGVFGPQTKAAVQRLQREHDLEADGVLGPQTAAVLGAAAPAATGEAPEGEGDGAAAQPATRPASGRAMTLDRSATRALQRALGVRADGVIGPATRTAIRAAERRNELRVDGRPDAALMRVLGVSTRDDGAADEPAATEEPSAGTGAPAAVAAATAKIGAPYSNAGNGPSSFDCSGLTVFAFKAAGITLPRTSFDQYREGSAVARADIQAGDLVFFNAAGPGASHVAVATGPTTVISATTRGVMSHSFSSGYWDERYVGARRVG